MRWRERKLHILLGEGLTALAKCEKDTENYIIDMTDWARTQNGKCSVCLAGATFPKRMHRQEGSSDTWPLPTNAFKAAGALDCLRQGDVCEAAGDLDLPTPRTSDRDMESYRVDRKQWWKDMRKLKAELKRRNE